MIDPTLLEQLDALYQPALPLETVLSNQIAALFHSDPAINWAGIYTITIPEECAWLYMFQGLPACSRIQFGHGVIGACIERNQPVCVDDVHQFPGHIACDARSNSELVIPLYFQNMIAAVLDLDSDQPAHFASLDQQTIQKLGEIFSRTLSLKELTFQPAALPF